jgi:hypothetical protein
VCYQGARYAVLESGSGSKTLTFSYEVASGDSTNHLNAFYSSSKKHTALIALVDEGQSIKRQSTSCITRADLSMVKTPVSKQLNQTSFIKVNGVIPVIESSFIHSFLPSSVSSIYKKSNVDTEILFDAFAVNNVTLGVASEVYINVTWSSAVTLIRGHHNLYLTVGKNTKQATYHAGNNTKNIQYKYIVELGDMLTRSTTTKCLKCYEKGESCKNPDACPWTIGLRFTPNALDGDIRQLSSQPVLSVEKSFLALKHADKRSGRSYGIPLYAFNDTSKFLFIDTSEASGGSRETYLIDITSSKSDGTYGAGENLYFQLEFSDDVIVSDGASPPRIRLNLNNNDP